MRKYLAILLAAALAFAGASQAQLIVNELQSFGKGTSTPGATVTTVSTAGITELLGLDGSATAKLWGAGGGGGGGENNASPNPGGGAGGGGGFLQFDYTFDSGKRYVAVPGEGGTGGNSDSNGGRGGGGAAFSAIGESGTAATTEADSTTWVDSTGTVTKADNGDGTWRWTFPASTATFTDWSASNMAPLNTPILVRARIKLVSGSQTLQWSVAGLTNVNFQAQLSTGNFVIVESFIAYEATTGSTIDLRMRGASSATPAVLDIDWIEFIPFSWIGIAAGGAGGGGVSEGNASAWGGGGAGGGDDTAGRNGRNGGNTTGGHGGSGASTSAGGAGGTGGGTGADGLTGSAYQGGHPAATQAVTDAVYGGSLVGSTGSSIGGPGGGSGGRYGGGSGEKAQTTNDGNGGGGSGVSKAETGTSSVTSTAGSDGGDGADGIAGTGGAVANAADSYYTAGAGVGGNGGLNGNGVDGTPGLVVVINPP